MALKLVIGLKSGKSVQKEIDDAGQKSVLGKRIGDTIKGEPLGLAGYEFEIRGGSDHCGFPMRRDVSGFLRKRLLFVEGVGLKKTAQGIRHRKTVCGQVVSPKITQLNVSIVKEGPDSLEPKSEAAAEAQATEAPKERTKKEETPAGQAPKKEEAPKEDALPKQDAKKEPSKEKKAPEANKDEPKTEPKKPESSAENPEAKESGRKQ